MAGTGVVLLIPLILSPSLRQLAMMLLVALGVAIVSPPCRLALPWSRRHFAMGVAYCLTFVSTTGEDALASLLASLIVSLLFGLISPIVSPSFTISGALVSFLLSLMSHSHLNGFALLIVSLSFRQLAPVLHSWFSLSSHRCYDDWWWCLRAAYRRT